MEIWTAATPNGWKVSIMLEELKEAGIELPEVEIKTINLSKGEQFSELFTRHNLNQKIPVLIDGERSIMESCAILQYLAEKYPTAMLPEGEARWDILPVHPRQYIPALIAYWQHCCRVLLGQILQDRTALHDIALAVD